MRSAHITCRKRVWKLTKMISEDRASMCSFENSSWTARMEKLTNVSSVTPVNASRRAD